MRKKKKDGKNTTPAIIFFSLIICAILASVLINALLIIKSSKFGSGPTFSIFISNNKQNEIVTFHKDSNSISVLKIDERVGDVHKFAEVPLDAVYYSSNLDLGKSVAGLTSDVFFKITTSQNNLNTYDGLRIFLMAKTVSPKDIKTKEIVRNLQESQRDEIFTSIFQDSRISEEGKTVQIINNTDEQGVGNRFSRIISNIGGNVILVSTGEEKAKSSIYSSEDSYSEKRLSEVLNFPIVKSKFGGIADITVIIGEDYNSLSKY